MKALRVTLSEAEIDIILKLTSDEITRQLHRQQSDPHLVGLMMKARDTKERFMPGRKEEGTEVKNGN